MAYERLITSPDPVLNAALSQVPEQLEWPIQVKRWAFLNYLSTGNPEFRHPLWLLNRTDEVYIDRYGKEHILTPEEVAEIVPTALALSGASSLEESQAFKVLENPYVFHKARSLDIPVNNSSSYDEGVTPLSDCIADPNAVDPEEVLIQKELVENVQREIARLNDNQIGPLCMGYELGPYANTQQIDYAKRLGVSREAIYQRRKLAERKLKKIRLFVNWLSHLMSNRPVLHHEVVQCVPGLIFLKVIK